MTVPFDKQRNRFGRSQPVELAASALRNASGNGQTFATGPGVVALTLDVTAEVAGTSLDVTVETSADGVTWRSAGTFAQLAGVGSERKTFMVDNYVRAAWAIVGTSFTFSIAGDA